MAHITTILGVVMVATAGAMLTSPLLAEAKVSPVEAQGMPNCDITCGNMSVPYPFGIGPARCYWPGFKLTCNRTSDPPRLLLGDGTLQVQELSLVPTFVAVIRIGDIKVDGSGDGTLGGGITTNGPYMISSNQFILVGCNVQATLKNGDMIMSSCSSVCENSDGLSGAQSTLEAGMQCSGTGCCQSDIVPDPSEVAGRLANSMSYDVQLKWFGWNRSTDHALVFVASKGWFNRTPVFHELLRIDAPASADAMQVPFGLDWEVVSHGAECSNVCKSKHSGCKKGKRGYTCFCKDGYHGNPYITDGCKDIDECNERYAKCYGDCTNSDGSYDCRCPLGTHGDATLPGGCLSSVSVSGNCIRTCGNVDVPYPFGIGSTDCYWPGFNLTCDTSQHPAKLLIVLRDLVLDIEDTFPIMEIGLWDNTVHILHTNAIIDISPGDSTSFLVFGNYSEAPYALSTGNEFILSGCNLQVTLNVDGPEVISSCASFCPSNVSDTYVETSLQHRGRNCQAHISMSSNGLPTSLMYRTLNKNGEQEVISQPPYVLIAEEGWFDQERLSKEIARQKKSEIAKVQVPQVLQWEVMQGLPRPADMKAHQGCPAEVTRKLCKSKNSYCEQGSRGYLCQCMVDYQTDGSNPYLVDGCKAYKSLSVGYLVAVIAVVAVIILFVHAHKKFKHRRSLMLKKNFEKNRGQLLQQLVSQRADIAERMIITLDELEKATNKFDKARELGGGGHGTVYKGILSDLHVVAIKKPKAVIQTEIDEFINEVAILSQINHRNVVKLYGCCLETEVPMLVYEFISNGTLYDHLHVDGPKSLSWNDRLRIATETARSLSYLHSTASVPIIHRDIKSVNILLDDTLTTKVADFGASRYVPVDRSGITTRVQGTRGYLDPMYFYTGRLTEKSDVYSFGVLLLELLTRKKPFSYISSEDEGLVTHFSTLFAQGNLSEILDPQVMEEGGREMEEVAAIAALCITLRGRPSMKQMEIKLEGTQASRGHESGNVRNCPPTADGSRSKELSRQYSMEEEFALSSRYPR